MEKFTASNDGTVEILDSGRLRVTDNNPRQSVFGAAKTTSRATYLDPNQIDALREFFQHERDNELGRWRYDSSLVIYQAENHQPDNRARSVYVLDESTGKQHMRHEGQPAWRETVHELTAAAAAYFAAHPERKPWHDAKPRELWEVSVSPAASAMIPPREALPMQVMVDDSGGHESLFFVHWNGPDVEPVDIEDDCIESARRVWPEGD